MNKVVLDTHINQPFIGTVNDLLCKAQERRPPETAFIGDVGPYRSDLFLITFGHIILATDPHLSWSDTSRVTLNKFVNIEIRIVE